jgi:hypothetical protein
MSTWGHSSAGRAPALQAGGRRFDPDWLHHPSTQPVLFVFIKSEAELFFNNSEVVLTSKIQAKSFLIFDFYQVNHVAFREPDM